jgi:hypothetical protein
VPAVAVFLTANSQVEARYRLPVPLVLTPVALSATQMGLRFPSEAGTTYTLQQTPRLTNPVWSTVETLTGDGSTMQFTRPLSPTGMMFFRLRTEQ